MDRVGYKAYFGILEFFRFMETKYDNYETDISQDTYLSVYISVKIWFWFEVFKTSLNEYVNKKKRLS